MIRGSLRRLVACLVVGAWVGALALPAFGAVHTSDLEDVAFGNPLVGVPHPVTQFEPVRAAATDGHCAVCHLQRAVRGAMLFASSSLASVEAVSFEKIARAFSLTTASFHALPSRSPPAVLANVLT